MDVMGREGGIERRGDRCKGKRGGDVTKGQLVPKPRSLNPEP